MLPVPLFIPVRALEEFPMQALTLLPYSRLIGVLRTVWTSLAGASVRMFLCSFSVVCVRGSIGIDPVACGYMLLLVSTAEVLQLV